MQKNTGSVKNVKERETVTLAQYLELEHCHLVVKVFITLQKIPLNLRQAAQREPVKDTCCFTSLFTAG